jgi:signal transduction histidine kinase
VATNLRALIIEDSADDAFLIVDTLQQGGFDLVSRRVQTMRETRSALEQERWDVIFADYMLQGFTGLDALALCRELACDTPFIVVSGSIGEDRAVDAMRGGASDYVMKDRLQRLPAAVERELREAKNRIQKRAAEQERDRQREELARTNEELAARAEQLLRSNRDLERFAFVAAHDLQEPLRNVRAFSQLLVRRYASDDAEAGEFAGYISEGVQRMEALIKGLLSYSRATHDGEISLRNVDTAKLVQALIRQMSGYIAQARAEVTCGFLPVVAADETQLSEILQNLLSNALKYAHSQRPAQIHIFAEQRDGDTLFSVRDNGVGIAPQYYDRIFLIFKRLHRAADIPGTGVGLALAKRLVENHRGAIWVESETGSGSTFRFTIPHVAATVPLLANTHSPR